MSTPELLPFARGEKPVDLLVVNARAVNVFSGEIQQDPIGIAAGRFVGFGNYPAKTVFDAHGRCVAPGFIDAHVHIESAMTGVAQFAWAVLPRGTTAVVADPHEIANVFGIEGIEYMMRAAEGLPLSVHFALPSCVPATDMETAGACLGADELRPMMPLERVAALAEVMNFPGVIQGDPGVWEKIRLARGCGKRVDGHAPGLSGFGLNAYIGAGVDSDHECTTAREAVEKLRAGMYIMIREGTGAKNLKDLLPVVNAYNARRIMWCTDDRHPHDLLAEGHIDAMVRAAVKDGLDPMLAVQMATLNPAQYFGLHHLGAIAPGRRADFITLHDLSDPVVEKVFCAGCQVAADGEMAADMSPPAPPPLPVRMNLSPAALDFKIPVQGRRVRVIALVPDQIITRQEILEAPLAGDCVTADDRRDILKIAVAERHHGSNRLGLGLVKGFGLRSGALASSVAHDSHNVIVVGADDEDMRSALTAVADMGGGLAVVRDGAVQARLPLPVAGLMSLQSVRQVRDQLDAVNCAARELGAAAADPFMVLSFLALPVIPELKITDRGLVDVTQFRVVSLFAD